jgi:hypothetical protein
MDHVFQISLKSVYLIENGEHLNKKGNTILSLALTYPNERITTTETVKKLPLQISKPVLLKSNELYSAEDFPYDNMFFEGQIQSQYKTILKATIGVAVSTKKIDKILLKAAEAGVVSLVGLLTGGIGATITVAVGQAVVKSLFEGDDNKDNVVKLAAVSAIISNDTPEGDYTLNLQTTDDMSFSLGEKQKGEDTVEVIETIKRGTTLATVIFNIVKIPADKAVPVIA